MAFVEEGGKKRRKIVDVVGYREDVSGEEKKKTSGRLAAESI